MASDRPWHRPSDSAAAALRLRERLSGKRVVLVCSGGNVTIAQLRELFGPMPAASR